MTRTRSLADMLARIPETFQVEVVIPNAGGALRIPFKFQTRDREGLREFSARLGAGMSDEEAIAEVATGWGLEDEFGPEAIARLCRTVPGAGFAIVQAYLQQSTGLRI